MSAAQDSGADEPVSVTDKRKVDPQTGEVREDTVDVVDGEIVEEAADSAADKVAELTADLQRAHADFANYRKRVERDRQSVIDNAKASVVTQLLGVLDDLDRARSHGDLEEGSPLRAVADKLVVAITGVGVAEFGTEGDDFDPALHEAVQHEGDGAHPVIGSVYRKGYRLGDKVLRTAMVAVTDQAPQSDAAGDNSAHEGAETGANGSSETSGE